MKAARIHQFGGPEVLTYEDVADPKPRKDHVLVRVKACSLNHLDIWVRKGLPGVNLPHILPFRRHHRAAAGSIAGSCGGAGRSPRHPVSRAGAWRAAHGQTQRRGQDAFVGGDPWLGLGHLLGQDRHAHSLRDDDRADRDGVGRQPRHRRRLCAAGPLEVEDGVRLKERFAPSRSSF